MRSPSSPLQDLGLPSLTQLASTGLCEMGATAVSLTEHPRMDPGVGARSDVSESRHLSGCGMGRCPLGPRIAQTTSPVSLGLASSVHLSTWHVPQAPRLGLGLALRTQMLLIHLGGGGT